MKIGVIREEKNPPDSRVTLSPTHCKMLIEKGLDVVVQPSGVRCFSDEDYLEAGIPMSEDLSDRTLLIGVKEVPIDFLIPDKTYFFFSHTFKAQPYNQKLLKAIVDKNITLIDYEVLTNDKGARVIAFGKFAGMVGAHNALWTHLGSAGEAEDADAAGSLHWTGFASVKLLVPLSGLDLHDAPTGIDGDHLSPSVAKDLAILTVRYEPGAHTDLGDAGDFSPGDAGASLPGRLPAVGAGAGQGLEGLEILDHGEEIEADGLVPSAGDLGAELGVVVDGLLEGLCAVLEKSLGGRLEHGKLVTCQPS